MRADAAWPVLAFVSLPQVSLPGNLVAIVQFVHRVKNRVWIFDLADRIFGKRFADAAFEFAPLFSAVEIVGHENAPTEAVFPKQLALLIREPPLAYLHCIEPRPVVRIAL